MRCGVLVVTSAQGVYSDIQLKNLWIKDVFYESAGFHRGKKEVHTPNGTQHYGWGVRFINRTDGALIDGIKMIGCRIENVSHTGIKFTAHTGGIRHLEVSDNEVFHSGGPGIQMSGVIDGLVQHNTIDGSGSDDDSRKWGRGSGLWTWGSSKIIITHNRFLHAHGPGDSAGCHIDFNCKDVIIQYNLSAHNAGGFCEILGNNFNCAYRYNISVNDGYREKGKDGAFQDGKIFWLSGFNGKNRTRKGPFNTYFYNNTIYVSKDIVAKFAVDKASKGVLIANNIFYIAGESRRVLGDQYKPEQAGGSGIEHVVFRNNLYLNEKNWPAEMLLHDANKLLGDPDFHHPGGLQGQDYVPQKSSLIKNAGIKIKKIPTDSIGLYVGLQVDTDIRGKKIHGRPDVGAIEIE